MNKILWKHRTHHPPSDHLVIVLSISFFLLFLVSPRPPVIISPCSLVPSFSFSFSSLCRRLQLFSSVPPLVALASPSFLPFVKGKPQGTTKGHIHLCFCFHLWFSLSKLCLGRTLSFLGKYILCFSQEEEWTPPCSTCWTPLGPACMARTLAWCLTHLRVTTSTTLAWMTLRA